MANWFQSLMLFVECLNMMCKMLLNSVHSQNQENLHPSGRDVFEKHNTLLTDSILEDNSRNLVGFFFNKTTSVQCESWHVMATQWQTNRELIPTPPLSLIAIPEPCAQISMGIIPHNPKVQTRCSCTHIKLWCYLDSPMRHTPVPLFV